METQKRSGETALGQQEMRVEYREVRGEFKTKTNQPRAKED